MSFETTPKRGVKAQYGARTIGGGEGFKKTSGITYEMAINFDGDTLHGQLSLPADSIVTHIDSSFSTGTITVATCGSTDIIAAMTGTPVPTPLGGKISLTGATAGTVIVEYKFSV